MKEKIKTINLDESWKIAREFADIIANRKIPLPIDYESNLPYPKEEILFALVQILANEKLEILRKKPENSFTIKDSVVMMIMELENFIPSENEYKKKVEEREYYLKEFSKEENIKMWKEEQEKWRRTL